ncbi:Predicted nucleic-acid-binding protein, contains PIN domain [Modicisalibacter ilicicola DSM 19980]|uniref:Predicted nucleic-acid-binding protein, contains PIN domain n=1 Tax=Modicisalibacter ilicicola DSM 19980 TaxID=1121942 RepID=A0A1M4WH16_9GAMM|nr:type II toxin-antitoxin system VapC family toxin [Halomonas ilicicola]SHE80477.1 Predicted nucleic-acid-binding protein, contains PIN domain [Halomonas ilicicola DSM 19980]
MIAIDTNVLLRYLLQDDEAQAHRAKALLQGETLVLITDIVLVETLWTLKGKKYRADKQALVDVINSLLQEPTLMFEDDETVWQALQDYRQKNADFPGALIARKAAYFARSKGEPYSGIYTFDRRSLTLPGTREG